MLRDVYLRLYYENTQFYSLKNRSVKFRFSCRYPRHSREHWRSTRPPGCRLQLEPHPEVAAGIQSAALPYRPWSQWHVTDVFAGRLRHAHRPYLAGVEGEPAQGAAGIAGLPHQTGEARPRGQRDRGVGKYREEIL